jgi:hypothetical protein
MIRKIVAAAFCLSLLGHFPVQGGVYNLDKARAFFNKTDVGFRADCIDYPYEPETLAAYREITSCADFYATDDVTRTYICRAVKNLKSPDRDSTKRIRNGHFSFSQDRIHSGMTPEQMMDAVDAYRNANPGFCFLLCIGILVNGTSSLGNTTVIIPSKYRQSFCDLCAQIIGT